MQKIILITGGAGFIGSHTCLSLADEGYKLIILDNLSNSLSTVIDRLRKTIGVPLVFIPGDTRDVSLLNRIFSEYPIDAVLHFAGLKAVGESVDQPLKYYDNNVNGALTLLHAMKKAHVKTFVFSSSATIYGNIATHCYQENHPRSPMNPYGRCKMIIEDILTDFYQSEPDWRIASLRYFNPVGAHESGLLGENPVGIPNNLMPYLTRVAAGEYQKLNIFGGDYETLDGTCIRDYTHVMDIAEGHIAVLNFLQENSGLITLNLGSGCGKSTLEVIHEFEMANSCKIPYQFVGRRPGDLPAYWADTTKIWQLLGWRAKRSMRQICVDAWCWQQNYTNEKLRSTK